MRDGERYEERERRRRRLGDRWWELASSQSRRSRPDGDLIRNRRREKRFTTTSSSSSSSVSSISWRCDASRLSLTSTENYVVGAGAALCGRWRDAIREEAGKRRGVGTRANERPRPSVTSRHCSDSQREKRGVASWQFHARTDLHPAQFPICRWLSYAQNSLVVSFFNLIRDGAVARYWIIRPKRMRIARRGHQTPTKDFIASPPKDEQYKSIRRGHLSWTVQNARNP